jgi:hypothetical protein
MAARVGLSVLLERDGFVTLSVRGLTGRVWRDFFDAGSTRPDELERDRGEEGV